MVCYANNDEKAVPSCHSSGDMAGGCGRYWPGRAFSGELDGAARQNTYRLYRPELSWLGNYVATLVLARLKDV